MDSVQINKKKILKYLGFYIVCFTPYIVIIVWINFGGLKGYDLQNRASLVISILCLFSTDHLKKEYSILKKQMTNRPSITVFFLLCEKNFLHFSGFFLLFFDEE